MNAPAQTSTERFPSVFDDIWKALQVHSLDLDSYRHEVIYARVEQTVDRSNPLHDINEAHCCALRRCSSTTSTIMRSWL